ncbi:FAD-dependent oxidoreductase [Mycoplasmoides pirum]|uniref:FAD-dependent oxidoreductase n=1 Tax=Mycoplasmoides pirum TaxID=2122 RepID=UPI000481E793|nr:FAD-dependent oxidoreductase [Mycoplasmoides pirum]
MKVIVVGINHAGTSAIRTLLTQNPSVEVVAFDRNDNISFLGCGIALTVSGVVQNINDLFYSNPEQLTGMGAKIHMRHDVLQVNPDKKTVTVKNLDNNQTFDETYDKLILAAGSWPICTPGIDLDFQSKYCGDIKNLVACKTFQHAQEIIENMKNPEIRSVAVIGSGYIGIELAEAAAIRNKQVTIIDMLPQPAGSYYDPEFTNDLTTAMEKHNVKVMMDTKVTEYIVDKKDRVIKGINTSNGKVDADLVILAIGFKPNTHLLPNADKVKNGAYIVNKYTETSIPDIYAIGGNCALFNAATGQHQNIDLATNAVKTGIVAASNINGNKNVCIESIVGTNAISVFGLNLASTGVSEETAKRMGMDVLSSYYEDNDRPEFMNTFEKIKFKLVYDKSTLRLVGAQIGSSKNANHTEIIYYLALAIQKNMTILDLAFADVYFLPHFNKPFNFVLAAILKALNLNYFDKK